MKPHTAPCGLDCSTCEAYQATQANDQVAKLRIVEKWRVDYNVPDMPVEAATCDGCSSEGRLGGYTCACPVRACSRKREIPTCAHCDDFSTCPTLSGFLCMAPILRPALEAIRTELGKA